MRVSERCAGMRTSVDVMKERLRVSQDELAAYCERWKIIEMSLIGSIPTDDIGADDPIEFLVRFEADVMRRYDEAIAMESELADIFGRGVDLIDYRSVVDWGENYIRRNAILESAQVIYAA